MARNSQGRFVAGDTASARVGGYALQARLRAEREALQAERDELRAILRDVWARWADVLIPDADLCERVKAALKECET